MMSRFARNDLFPQATMYASPPTSEAGPSTTLQRQDSATAAIAAVLDDPIPDVQPNENTPAPAAPAPRRAYNRKPKTGERTMAYTSAFVPGMYNIKNPAGDYLAKESNVEVVRQISQLKVKRRKESTEAERQRLIAEGQELPEVVNPLSNILIIHPGSRNLRIGRANDFYPKEIPNCIARPKKALIQGSEPPIPGSRAKREGDSHEEGRDAKKAKIGPDPKANGHTNGDGPDEVDQKIGYLRDYLKSRLAANRLATDWREGSRVRASNQKVRPESIPEHNDPYRIDWTESNGKTYFIGQEALQLPDSAGYSVRYPILGRGLNLRDWSQKQLLMDDMALILQESLKQELNIHSRDYSRFAVVLIVPDHGDRPYIQEFTRLLMGEMGFREIAIHQEALCAVFSAGMSSACVVDVGASRTSVTCVDEGVVSSDSRLTLNYGGDDITVALVEMLQRSAFPYKDLQLAQSQQWKMMDNLKIKICTLEEHLVASTPWDFYVLNTTGLTQKYIFRTYDENILAPLVFFDTRLIDFDNKRPIGSAAQSDEEVDDLLYTLFQPLECAYEQVTVAMRAVSMHLVAMYALPAPPAASVTEAVEETKPESTPQASEAKTNGAVTAAASPAATNGEATLAPPAQPAGASGIVSETPTPAPEAQAPSAPALDFSVVPDHAIFAESAKSPLDGAIAASISAVGNESKVRSAASNILLIGGGSAMKGIRPFIAERLPSLLRSRGQSVDNVSLLPPPRNVNPRFVSWKGASVMCNIEGLQDMWIGRDEWEALGDRALQNRCPFL